jgi:hypothetical protein
MEWNRDRTDLPMSTRASGVSQQRIAHLPDDTEHTEQAQKADVRHCIRGFCEPAYYNDEEIENVPCRLEEWQKMICEEIHEQLNRKGNGVNKLKFFQHICCITKFLSVQRWVLSVQFGEIWQKLRTARSPKLAQCLLIASDTWTAVPLDGNTS